MLITQDPKQANGAAAAVLGLVRGVEYKAKGGARIQLVDASGSTYSIAEKHVHINLGSYKGKAEEVADILKEYTAIMATEPTDLGVEPGDLEMAWELASDEDKASFSPKFLLSLVDDTFSKAQTDTLLLTKEDELDANSSIVLKALGIGSGAPTDGLDTPAALPGSPPSWEELFPMVLAISACSNCCSSLGSLAS